ncbi:unnamed protein product [Periconia digitata]|uniref:Uncharacterized protein n=1 Tax=Periconia digitata TaxID=1303443 RepID=A0A9W4XS99_9PLEO|nr:unnamed protein product [Periconia digitata]
MEPCPLHGPSRELSSIRECDSAFILFALARLFRLRAFKSAQILFLFCFLLPLFVILRWLCTFSLVYILRFKMAVVTTQSSGEAEVSNCVQNIILAFTDGLNVFKRLKERSKRKKSKQNASKPEDVPSEAELQLSTSLRRGPVELRDRYERCYGEKGEAFAKGDATAHASLAETLIKLNTGLVRIIATFLNCNSKSSSLHLDYKSLISLSDASRREAMESLNQLHSRLSQSQLHIHRMSSSKSEQTDKKRHAASSPSSRQRINGPIVARASVKNSNQKQLVMVRPKHTRKGSTTSSSSSSMKSPHSTTVNSSISSSPSGSAMGSPLPQYSPKDPFPPMQKTPPKMNSGGKRKGVPSTPHQRPTKVQPHPKLDELSPLPSPQHTPSSPSYNEKHIPSSSPPSIVPLNAAIARRRLDKLTPSSYTFASDSTKLGEIPQRNWTVPWDYEGAERLNAAAAQAGYYPVPTAAAGRDKKQKKGLFKFMRRGSAVAV